jgi:hypothetical protein
MSSSESSDVEDDKQIEILFHLELVPPCLDQLETFTLPYYLQIFLPVDSTVEEFFISAQSLIITGIYDVAQLHALQTMATIPKFEFYKLYYHPRYIKIFRTINTDIKQDNILLHRSVVLWDHVKLHIQFNLKQLMMDLTDMDEQNHIVQIISNPLEPIQDDTTPYMNVIQLSKLDTDTKRKHEDTKDIVKKQKI